MAILEPVEMIVGGRCRGHAVRGDGTREERRRDSLSLDELLE